MKHKPKFVTSKHARRYMIESGFIYIEDLLKDGGEWICGDNHKTVKQVDKCAYCTEYYRRMDERDKALMDEGAVS